MLRGLDFDELLEAGAGLMRSLAPGQNLPHLARVEAEHGVRLEVEVLVDLVGRLLLLLAVAHRPRVAMHCGKEGLVGLDAGRLGILNHHRVFSLRNS